MVQSAWAELAARLRGLRLRTVLAVTIVGLSLASLVYFLYRNRQAVLAYQWQINYAYLGWTILLHLAAFVVAILAWHSIVQKLAGASDLRLNARVYCYSAVARRLPGLLWDLATRVVMYDQAGISKALAGAASLVEFVLVTAAGIVLYVALMPFSLAQSQISLWPLLGALGLGLALTHPRVVTAAMQRLGKGRPRIVFGYRDSVRWLGTYVLSWMLGGLILYATIHVIYDLSPAFTLQAVADWSLAGAVTAVTTFVPAGLGLREVTLTLLLSRYVPEHIAVASAILMRLLMTGYSMVWLLLSTRL